MLGYWIGNGHKSNGNVTCNREDKDEILSILNEKGYEVGAVRDDPHNNGTSIGIKTLKVSLRNAGVLDNKHIPIQYLRAAEKDRKALLAGLLDSDGHIDKYRGRTIFTTTDKI